MTDEQPRDKATCWAVVDEDNDVLNLEETRDAAENRAKEDLIWWDREALGWRPVERGENGPIRRIVKMVEA